MAIATTAAILAGLANAGMSLYANRRSQEAMQRYRNALQADKERAIQDENYLRNVDPLSTKSGQALSTDMAEKMKASSQAAAGRSAVMGGSAADAAATKDVNAQLMSAYQRSLIRQHEMNTVPQLNYYRRRFDTANAALEKAEYDRSVANINAASQAAQGMINAAAAVGSQAGTFAGNGTKAGAVQQTAAQAPQTSVAGGGITGTAQPGATVTAAGTQIVDGVEQPLDWYNGPQ